MAIRNEVTNAFAADPEDAIKLVERDLFTRDRRIVPLFVSLFECIDNLVNEDARKAVSLAERALGLVFIATGEAKRGRPRKKGPRPKRRARSLRSDLGPMGYGVLGIALYGFKQPERALRILQRTAPASLDVEANLSLRRAIVLTELRRFGEAETNASIAIAFYEENMVSRPTNLHSLAAALLTRSFAVGSKYIFGTASKHRLKEVANDAKRALESAHDCGLDALANRCLINLGNVLALTGFTQGSIEFSEVSHRFSRQSACWAHARWMEASLDTARYRTLRPIAEVAYMEARDVFESRGEYNQAAMVTIDMQAWFLGSGQRRRAMTECVWLDQNLGRITRDREVVRAWVCALRAGQVSGAIVEAMFCKIRGLPGPIFVHFD